MKKNILEITSAACRKLYDISKQNNTQNILFYVKGGGCNGFNYVFEPMYEKPHKFDEIIKRKDYNLVICNKSVMHVMGTKIHWRKDIMGESFEFVNPMAQSECGCGTSFSSKANN